METLYHLGVLTVVILGLNALMPDNGGRTYSGSSSLDDDPELVDVRPYTRSDGTPVRGHQRTWPDDDSSNNFSSPSGLSRDTSLSGLSSGNGSFSF